MSLHCGGREQVSVSSCALLQSMFGRWLSKVLPTHVWGLSTVSLHKKLDLMTLPVILSAVEAGTAWSLEVVTLASSWVLCLGRDYISKRKKNKIKWKCDQGGHAGSNSGPNTRENKISAGLGAWEQAGSVALFLDSQTTPMTWTLKWVATHFLSRSFNSCCVCDSSSRKVTAPVPALPQSWLNWMWPCDVKAKPLILTEPRYSLAACSGHTTSTSRAILGPHWLWLKMYH